MATKARSQSRIPRGELKVCGVYHSTRGSSGLRFPFLKHLYAELKQLKSQGITQVGVEFIEQNPLRTPLERKSPDYRYGRGMALLMGRLGMRGIPIDDPLAFQLNAVLDDLCEREGVPDKPLKEKGNLQKLKSYCRRRFDFVSLVRAIRYYRSLAMTRLARKLGLRAIIVGKEHAGHLQERGYTIVQLDSGSNPVAVQNDLIAFREYKQPIARILRDMKSGKLRFD